MSWFSFLFLLLSVLVCVCPASSSFVPSFGRSVVPVKESTSELYRRQVPAATTSESFVRRAFQASAVAGNYLYIEGGEISYILGDSVVNQYASNTLSIDLSQDWVNSSVIFNSITKPAGAPLLSDSSLWYDQDNDVFYSGFTGRSSLFGDQPDPPPISVWSFKPDGAGGGSWKVDISPDDPKWSRRTRTDWGYTASGGGSALVLGGVLNPWTTPASMNVKEDVVVPGLIEFNMTKKGFYNSSATGFNAKGVGGRGAMHYVPSFGPNGLFLVMGGTDFSDPDQNIGFDNIWVYETLENRWYNQTATGSLPAGRRNFCLAGIASTNETYEVFLYGGFDGHLGSASIPYDEIFILTLPAFHWFRVPYLPLHPRHGHSCNAVGGSQIISVGGVDSNAKITTGYLQSTRESSFNSSRDPFAQGLAIFDMTTLEWAERYMAGKPMFYEQSELVKSYYRDTPPNASRFGSSTLENLFQVTHFEQPPPSTSPSPPSPPTSSPPSSAPNNTALITASTIGTILALTLLLSFIFFLYRRRRRQNPHHAHSDNKNQDSMKDKHELHGSEQQIQEADADAARMSMQMAEMQGGWRIAELEEEVVRAEMGGDEVGWVGEMEAREGGGGRGRVM